MQDVALRLAVFLALVTTLVAAEALFPRRARVLSRRLRWPHNLLLVASNSLLGRLLLPMAPVALAASLQDSGVGLVPALGLRGVPAVIVAFVLMDLAIYLQHVLFHHLPLLWRLHRMHHADVDLDVTSGLRFHPIEILLSLGIKLAVVTALGAPPAAVLLFEVVLNGAAMFNHANMALPVAVDRVLRWIIVTPDMHRVHHSTIRREADSNFGFNLPWWDRLFGTYIADPEGGQTGMTVGLTILRDPSESTLWNLWTQPFRTGRPAPRHADDEAPADRAA